MLTKTTTILNLEPDASYPYMGGSSKEPQAGPSNLREGSAYRPVGASQPIQGSEPVTPPRVSNSQPVSGPYYKTYYISRPDGLPPLPHHVQCNAPTPGGSYKPAFKPLHIERFRFGSLRDPSPPRRTPSPILPVPSFILRPPFEPKGVWDTKGGPLIARDFAYADRNPIRPKEPKKKREERKKKVEPVDALKLLQNNRYFNPTGLPFPLVDKRGQVVNGEEAFPHLMLPGSMTPPPRTNADLANDENVVLTPIMSPNGTLTYPDDPDYATAKENAQNPPPVDVTQTNLGPMLERIAAQLNRQREAEDSDSETPSSTPTPRRTPPPLPTTTQLLHPLFGAGSSLTSVGSSASAEGTVTGEQGPPTEEMEAVRLTANEAGDSTHRYQLRQRHDAQPPAQSPTVRRSPRSRNNTPSRSPPQTRIKENATQSPLLNHPHATRPVTRMPPPLKRMRDEEGSSASLQGSPAVAEIVVPARIEENDAAETSQRMTRSRARKARRLEAE